MKMSVLSVKRVEAEILVNVIGEGASLPHIEHSIRYKVTGRDELGNMYSFLDINSVNVGDELVFVPEG